MPDESRPLSFPLVARLCVARVAASCPRAAFHGLFVTMCIPGAGVRIHSFSGRGRCGSRHFDESPRVSL